MELSDLVVKNNIGPDGQPLFSANALLTEARYSTEDDWADLAHQLNEEAKHREAMADLQRDVEDGTLDLGCGCA